MSSVARRWRTYATGRTRPREWRIPKLEGIERLLSDRESAPAAGLAETSSGRLVVNHLALQRLMSQLPSAVSATRGECLPGGWGFQQLSHPRAMRAEPARPDPS